MDFSTTALLLLPLISAAVILLFFRHNGQVASYISVGSAAVILLLALKVIFGEAPTTEVETGMTWLKIANLDVRAGFLVDAEAKALLFVVAFVGFLMGFEIPLAMRINNHYTPDLKVNLVQTYMVDLFGGGLALIVWKLVVGVIPFTILSFYVAAINLIIALATYAYFVSQRMIKRTFKPGFRIELHQKDLNLALSGAKEMGLSLPNTATAQELFNACKANGGAGWDHSAMVRALELMAKHNVK